MTLQDLFISTTALIERCTAGAVSQHASEDSCDLYCNTIGNPNEDWYRHNAPFWYRQGSHVLFSTEYTAHCRRCPPLMKRDGGVEDGCVDDCLMQFSPRPPSPSPPPGPPLPPQCEAVPPFNVNGVQSFYYISKYNPNGKCAVYVMQRNFFGARNVYY